MSIKNINNPALAFISKPTEPDSENSNNEAEKATRTKTTKQTPKAKPKQKIVSKPKSNPEIKPPEPRSARLNLLLTHSLKQDIQEIASRQYISMNQYIHETLEKAVAEEKQ